MLKAVLFDMDGVIVDNRDAHLAAFVEFAKRHGIDLDPNVVLPYFGSTNAVIMKAVFGRELEPDELERYAEEKEEIYREIYYPVIAPAEGLVDLLKALRAAGVKTAVGSSAPRVNVDFVLERCGIAEYFDAVASGSEITRSKPDPEVYLLAASKLDVAPQYCVVCEDAFVGVEAARNAGMHVIAVASTFAREMHKDYDLLIDDFREVTVSDIEKIS